MDAFISERLTSSERIVDIYGHCGLSILSEFVDGGYLEDIIVPGEGYMKPKNLDDHDDVKPQNNLTANDKLLIALEMAESIALLHNYPGGRIVHDDIQLSQFLRTKNGYIKLNDFNRAEIMLWDEENQKYCKYRNDPGHGNVSWRHAKIAHVNNTPSLMQ
jgi:serine/threonine protein kinase